MATNFPGSLDNSTSLPYPTALNGRNAPSLAQGQDNQNDAVIATETKLGTGASTPTLNNLLIGTGVGTSAWSKAAPTGTIVGTTDSQTLTNKILTSPVINSPVITNATISADSIVGFTTANSGTVYGVAITAGQITGANTVNGSALVAASVPGSAIVAGGIGTTQLANASVTPNKLSTGSASSIVATSQTTTSTVYTDLATVGPTITITVGSNGLVLLSWAARLINSGANYTAISFTASGTNTITAADTQCIAVGAGTDSTFGKTILLTGLNPGSTTFTLKYRVTGGTGTFIDRMLSGVPL